MMRTAFFMLTFLVLVVYGLESFQTSTISGTELIRRGGSGSSTDHNSSNTTGSHDDHAAHAGPSFAPILFFCMSIVIGCSARAAISSGYLPLPYTVVIFLVGFIWGIILFHEQDNIGVFGTAMEDFKDMDPHLFLMVFLPALLFESGLNMNIHIFKRVRFQALLLAGPGVMITMVIAGAFIKLVFPYGWGWDVCLLFGAMAAATDPVAVVALLGELGAPASLGTLVEGESLANDGTAFVAFLVILDGIKTGSVGPGDVITSFLRLAVAGAVLGAVAGFATTQFLKRNYTSGDSLMEHAILLVAPYLVFYLAEGTPLHLSGVLAVVVYSIYIKEHAHFQIFDFHGVHVVWEFLTWNCNTLVFLTAGGMVGYLISDTSIWSGEDHGYLIVLYFGLMITRVITIAILYPFLMRMGYGFDYKKGIVLTWGALRGAIGLAMGAIVLHFEDLEKAVKDKVFLHISGIVCLTLVVNGSTMKYVLEYLGLTTRTRARKILATDALAEITEHAIHEIQTLKKQAKFHDADWRDVQLKLDLNNFEQLFLTTADMAEAAASKAEVEDKNPVLSTGLWADKQDLHLSDANQRHEEALHHKRARLANQDAESLVNVELEEDHSAGHDGHSRARAHSKCVTDFEHSKVTDEQEAHFDEKAEREVKDQFLHAFVASVERYRSAGELTASSAAILMESAEVALDEDNPQKLDATWWTDVVQPKATNKLDNSKMARAADCIGFHRASSHFRFTGKKRSIEVAKAFDFLARECCAIIEKETEDFDSVMFIPASLVLSHVRDGALPAVEKFCLEASKGYEHVSRQVDTRRALGHIVQVMVEHADHMKHDGKIKLDEHGMIDEELHRMERCILQSYTSNALIENQTDVLRHTVLFDHLLADELDELKDKAELVSIHGTEENPIDVDVELLKACPQKAKNSSYLVVVMSGSVATQIKVKGSTRKRNATTEEGEDKSQIGDKGGMGLKKQGDVIGAARVLLKGLAFEYDCKTSCDTEVMMLDLENALWLAQSDAATDDHFWELAALEAYAAEATTDDAKLDTMTKRLLGDPRPKPTYGKSQVLHCAPKFTEFEGKNVFPKGKALDGDHQEISFDADDEDAIELCKRACFTFDNEGGVQEKKYGGFCVDKKKKKATFRIETTEECRDVLTKGASADEVLLDPNFTFYMPQVEEGTDEMFPHGYLTEKFDEGGFFMDGHGRELSNQHPYNEKFQTIPEGSTMHLAYGSVVIKHGRKYSDNELKAMSNTISQQR